MAGNSSEADNDAANQGAFHENVEPDLAPQNEKPQELIAESPPLIGEVEDIPTDSADILEAPALIPEELSISNPETQTVISDASVSSEEEPSVDSPLTLQGEPVADAVNPPVEVTSAIETEGVTLEEPVMVTTAIAPEAFGMYSRLDP